MSALSHQFVNYDLGCGGQLVVDPKKLSIVLAGATGDPEFGSFDFEAECKSVEELEKVYLERVVPYFEKFNCFDIERNRDVKLPTDLRKHFGELMAVDEVPVPKMAGDGTLDQLVANTCTLFRRCINAAVGSEQLTLHSVVFISDDSGLSVLLNVPAIEGLSQTQLKKRLGDDDWLEGEASEDGAWSLETSPIEGMEALAPYGDPDNFYERCFAQLTYLACALIEKEPGLRANVTTGKNFKVLITERGYVDSKLRAAAKRRMEKPAKEYFDATQ